MTIHLNADIFAVWRRLADSALIVDGAVGKWKWRSLLWDQWHPASAMQGCCE